MEVQPRNVNDPDSLLVLRMELRAAEAEFYFDPGSPADDQRTLEDLQSLHRRLEETRNAIRAYAPSEGEWSCLLHDDPVFGKHNPPRPGQFLYHYTRVATLPKIRADRSLRFGPLSSMADPQESLDLFPSGAGLISSGPSRISQRDHLRLTSLEATKADSIDWALEMNKVRHQVNVGSFATDREPNLRGTRVADALPSRVADDLYSHRAFASPHMWASYADSARGVCLVFDAERLLAAFEAFTRKRGIKAGYGDVRYVPSPSLGWVDIGILLEEGPEGVVLANYEQALLEKHSSWSSESEFRLFVLDAPDSTFFLPLPEGAIVGVVLGPGFEPAKHIRNVRPFARDFNIRHRVRRASFASSRCELGMEPAFFNSTPEVRPDVGTRHLMAG